MKDKLWVSEMFGPTIQGEGPSQGQPAMFLRLAGCNLACVWCDTPYSWDWTRYHRKRETRHEWILQLVDWLGRHPDPMLVITGGEPLLQHKGIVQLLEAMPDGRRRRVEIETNGTRDPGDLVYWQNVRFNVSPKLANSGDPEDQRIKSDPLKTFRDSGRAVFKFVATSVDDLDEISNLADVYGLEDVWVMPEATDTDGALVNARVMTPFILDRGFNVAMRQHVLLWPKQRGH